MTAILDHTTRDQKSSPTPKLSDSYRRPKKPMLQNEGLHPMEEHRLLTEAKKASFDQKEQKVK